MLALLRRLIALTDIGCPADDAIPSDASPRSKLYNGLPVPLQASRDPDEAAFYDNFYQAVDVVPHADGKSVLVFPATFLAETANGGVVCEEVLEGDPDPASHIQCAVKIYEHITADHPRVVRYLGTTPSGYRLERLSPGPIPWTLPQPNSPAVMALYQSWALQILSALTFLHSHGVYLNGLTNETLWLREDFTVAIARLIKASCANLRDGGNVQGSTSWAEEGELDSQWSLSAVKSFAPNLREERGLHLFGDFRSDLFDWATWAWRLFTGQKDLTGGDLDRSDQEEARDYDRRRKQLASGTFTNFPQSSETGLGSVLNQAWKGMYASAEDALADTKRVLRNGGANIDVDEVQGFNWPDHFEIIKGSHGRPEELRPINSRNRDP